MCVRRPVDRDPRGDLQECFPGSALITVTGCARPGILIEIQGMAVVGGNDGFSERPNSETLREAPDITSAIVNGRQLHQLNAKTLMRRASRSPVDWAEQRALLEF